VSGLPATLAELVDGFEGQGDRTAILSFEGDEQRPWSYRELRERVLALAGGLRAAGVGVGEPIVLLAPPSPEWIAAFLAVVVAGALPVPLAETMRTDELRRLLEHSRGHRVITTKARLDDLPDDAAAWILDGEGDERALDRLAGEPADIPDLDPDSPACLLYTSGTTGMPKGVPLTHRNILSNVGALIEAGLAGHDDRIMLPLPLHHTYPLTVGVLGSLAMGATLVLPEGLAGPQILRALADSRATVMIGVPRLYNALIEAIEGRVRAQGGLAARLFGPMLKASIAARRRLGWRLGRRLFGALHQRMGGALRLLGSGGAKLDPVIADKLEGLGFEVLIGYGLTETSPILTFQQPGDGRPDTVGTAVPGVEIRIDREGAEDAPEGQGEIQARGPNVFEGYLRNDEANAEAFTEDGWYRTGDLGLIDEDGHLRITGRARELIVLGGGKNVFPEDVEKALQEDPVLEEVAVLERGGSLVGLVRPDTERLRAQGSARAGAALREAVEAGSRKLARHERLAGYAVVHEPLPRTQLGKLQRHLLPDIYERARGERRPAAPERREEDEALLAKEPAGEVFGWLKERLEQPELSLDTSPQLDLELDSFAWMSLALEIEERFAVPIGDEELASAMSIRDLLEAVVAAAEKGGERRPVDPEALLGEEQKRWLRPRGPVLVAVGAALWALDWAVMRGLFRLEVHGREHLPREGAVVLTPNHLSYLDPFVIAAALPHRDLARLYWAGWTGVAFRNPLARLFSRIAQIVPVDPDRGVAASLAIGLVVLKRGHGLVWFPEGRRSPDGELEPFQAGVGHVLQRSGVPAVPVWIGGTREALPPGRAIPRFPRLTVTFGEPVGVEELGGEEAGPQEIADRLRDRVARLAG
jgi:long-chain acyl-CoA synthetase